jgi:hypothetical protein
LLNEKLFDWSQNQIATIEINWLSVPIKKGAWHKTQAVVVFSRARNCTSGVKAGLKIEIKLTNKLYDPLWW